MPTTRPRHQITETPEIARAIESAAKRWPGQSRSELVRRLIEAGESTLDSERVAEKSRRLRAIERTSGAYSAEYPGDYLSSLRQDWPA